MHNQERHLQTGVCHLYGELHWRNQETSMGETLGKSEGSPEQKRPKSMESTLCHYHVTQSSPVPTISFTARIVRTGRDHVDRKLSAAIEIA